MSKMKFGLHFDDLKSDFWRQISAGAAAKGATPTDMSDDDSDGDGSGGGLVVLPHLSLSDVLFRKIFSWGRFVVVLGIVAGLVFCEPKPVVASSLKHVKPGVDYKKKICDGKLNPDSQHFDEGYLESVKSRKYADVGDAEAAPLFANGAEEREWLRDDCDALAQVVAGNRPGDIKGSTETLQKVYGPVDTDFVWVFGLIALLIVLSVEGKPSDALLLFLGLAFRELGIITTGDIFSGLGKAAPVLFGSLFVISAAFNETRVLERMLSPVVGAPQSYWGLIFRLLLPVMLLSGVCANGPVCSMAMPLAAAAAEKVGFDPKNFYLPLAYATSLGGLLTLIGSPPNITVMGYMNNNEANVMRCTQTMYRIKQGQERPDLTLEKLKDDKYANAYCKFSIFDPGFLATGAANCVVGAIFLWINMMVLSKKYPSKQQIAEKKQAEEEQKSQTQAAGDEKAIDDPKVDEEAPLVTAKPLAVGGMMGGYVCDFLVSDTCGALIGKTFGKTPLSTTPGVTLEAAWLDKKSYRQALREEAGELTLRDSGAEATTSGAIAAPKEKVWAPGNVLRVTVKAPEAVARVRRVCEGLQPASKYSSMLGRKRYKRLLYELAMDPKIAGESCAKYAAEDALFEDLQCCKLGYNEQKNIILVEAFSGEKFQKAVKDKRPEITLVKPVPNSKPPRSVTKLDQTRGYIVFAMFMGAVALAAVSGAHPALKRFEDIHTYFTIIAMCVVWFHILTWKNAVNTMSSSVLFTFAFADATAAALEKSGAVKLISNAIEGVGGMPAGGGAAAAALQGQTQMLPAEGGGSSQELVGGGEAGEKNVVGVMVLLFVALSVVTQFINNNTTAQLFQAATLQVACSLDIPPKPLLALVVFGASACFCTPFGTSCNMYVQGPGGYTFSDYCSNGWMLQISSLIASVGCCYVWVQLLMAPEENNLPLAGAAPPDGPFGGGMSGGMPLMIPMPGSQQGAAGGGSSEVPTMVG